MRILITAALYGRGGTETHLLHLSKLLIENGHEVILACRYADRSVPLVQAHKQMDVKRLSTPFDMHHRNYRWSTLAAMMLWPFFLFGHRADLIITLEQSRFLHFLGMFLKRNGFILLLRAGLPTSPTELVHKDVLAKLSGVLVETPMQAAASTVAHPRLPTKAIPLLGNIADDIPIRKPFSNRPDRVVCLAFLGRYDKKKGVHRLVEIWANLNLPNARLEFYGHGTEKTALHASIAQKSLEHCIQVNDGWITPGELAAIMEKIDLLILPSEEEGLPVILMEAMAYGVPFIATDVGAVRAYAQDNPDVRVVPLDNQQITTAIEEMVQSIREGRVDGQRLQKYYRERYAYDKLATAWLDAIENVDSWAT